LSRPQIQKSVLQVLQARVGLLLGQTTFEELLPLQERVSLELARGALLWHGRQPQEGAQALAQAMRAHYVPLPHADAQGLSQAVRLAQAA
jgi:hypothetical protein